MTRDTAVKASHLIFKIESLEMLIDELENLESLDEYYGDFGDSTLQEEIVAVVQVRLDKALKELEEM
jgi:hypothetical protein